ncbi:MAG: glycosyl hydrolase family 28-related protein [Verrucomicrobiota bacterium]|jgi:hypothetical protein
MNAKLNLALALAWVGLLNFDARGAKPEISYVFPDFPTGYPNASPHILTGENFDPAKTEVWTWQPRLSDSLRDAVEQLGKPTPELPAQPPEGAQRVGPLDVERQIIVAPLQGSVVWVKTAEGFSKPYLFHVAKPLWVSEEQAEPGALVHVFGFGLPRSDWVLKSASITLFPRTIVEARALRTADRRLVYFQVPADASTGKYELFCHDSNGGAWGWQKAGDLEIVVPKPAGKLFDVRKFGAKGDGLANDRNAMEAAIAAAQKAGGGIVFFPPGTHLTDSTLAVPSGVRLRGASRDNCILQGFGDARKAARAAWFQSLPPPTAVIRLHNDTGLESLTVQGATWLGATAVTDRSKPCRTSFRFRSAAR